MSPFRYSSQVLQSFLKERKGLQGKKLIFRDVGSGKEVRVPLECETGRVAILEWVIRAGQVDVVTTYHASLLIDYQRIRGVDYFPIERRRFFKVRIPKGWHENVIDPNTGENRHESV